MPPLPLVGAILAVVAVILIVPWLGFTTGGIAAGSWAAWLMSAMAPTEAGGIVATLQSVGAAGLGPSGIIIVAIIGAVVCLAMCGL